jgi:hypothetical protein
MGQTAFEPRTANEAGVLARAKLCNCDVYVERGQADTAVVVELGPPPKTRSIFGTAHLAQALSESRRSARVLFAGFEEDHAAAVSLSAVQRAKRTAPREGGFASLVDSGARLFERASGTVRNSLGLAHPNGKLSLVVAEDPATSVEKLHELLAARPDWKNASVQRGSRNTQLIEVTFPDRSRGLGGIRVQALGPKGERLTSSELSTIAIAGARQATAASGTVSDVVERLGQRLTREGQVSEVRFFLDNVGNSVRQEEGDPELRFVRVAVE